MDWTEYDYAVRQETGAYQAYVSLMFDQRTAKVRAAREEWVEAYHRRKQLRKAIAEELGIRRREVDHRYYHQRVSASARAARRAR